MDQPLQGLDPDKLPQLAEAYQLALRIKQSQRIADPLELRVELGEPPKARLLLGELLLAEQEISQRDVERLLGVEQSSWNPRETLAGLESRIQAGRESVAAWLGKLQWPKLKLNVWNVLIGLVLAGLLYYPAYLVFLDRWAGALSFPKAIDDLWQQLGFLQALSLPHYFGAVFACLLGVLALILALPKANRAAAAELLRQREFPTNEPEVDIPAGQQRKGLIVLGVSALAAVALAVYAIFAGRFPSYAWALALLGLMAGAALLTSRVERWMARWRERRGLWISMAAAHLALLGLLASLYSTWFNPWAMAAIVLVALANLLTYRKRVPAIYWLVNAAMLLYSLNINGWWFATVGDEFTFYREAVHIAQEGGLGLIGENLFNGVYVYSAHPFFSSLMQAAFIKIFGASNFAWRMSSLYYTAVSLPFFYYFFKTFLRKRYALAACALLAASSYIMTFGKVGYNNLQALLAFGVVLAASAFAIRRRSILAFLLVGAAQAFCFYVYPAALYVAPLPYLFLLFYYPPSSLQRVRGWALSVVALVVGIFPLLLQPGFWAAKVAGTIAYTPELVQDSGRQVFHFVSNFVYSLIAPLFNVAESHFVSAGNMDLITAMLSFLGLAILLASFWRRKFFAAWLLGFMAILFLAGMSHDREFPPNTRMFLLLPFLAVMAVLALAWLKATLQPWGFSEGWLRGLGAVALVAILGVNLYQANILSFRRSTGYQNFEALFLHMSQKVFTNDSSLPSQVLIFHDPKALHIPSLTELLDIYGVPYQADEIQAAEPAMLDEPQVQALALDPASVVIVDVRLPDEDLEALNEYMGRSRKEMCEASNALGHIRFYLWHTPQMSWACPGK